MLTKKTTLERYPYHHNPPARSRPSANTGAAQTDNLGQSIGVTLLSRSPIDIHYSYISNIRLVDLQWQKTFTLERSPLDTDYTICVPISGRIEWQHAPHLVTTAVAIDPDGAFPGIASTNGRVLVVGFDRSSIELVLAKLLDRELKQPISFESAIDLDTDFGTSLKEFIEFLGRSHAPGLNLTSPTIQEELAGALLTCLLKGVKHNYSDEILYCCQGAFACYVKQASSFIAAHLQEEIELADIAAAVNISPRLLQKAFAQECDCSPMRFVSRSRLERIRQELERSSDATRIIDVMMNYGITQGGKFAKEYQQLFGEKPSDTLKRASQLDRHPRMWQEIDDACSERIVGGAVIAHTAGSSRSVPMPPCDRAPALWGSYWRSIGIDLSARLYGDLDV
ncbi:helix-turn-helix transcriptional regulator [Chamaesiphon sp. OTE_8_metabat_110]|uniref:helix-turn-helix transcriptional regulator n=1 Tax=Chamaesiphon sp. OTE_8_metabat_110 TaxID=2964696 RepID=UPI00286B1405|nr:helix-turn-helix transcriptional regulator [Chamaesiphon sp. OTE_8_metabat_110]